MKKFFLPLLFLVVFFVGCVKENYASNLSEVHTAFFLGETEHYRVWLSSGMREEPYIMDGVSQNKVEFALLCIKPKENENREVACSVSINKKAQVLNLEQSPFDNTLACDLGKIVNRVDTVFVSVSFMDKTEHTTLSPIFNEYKIKTDEAFEIVLKTLREHIKLDEDETFELYLKIIFSKDTPTTQFWYGSILTSTGKESSCVIDTQSGEVLVCR